MKSQRGLESRDKEVTSLVICMVGSHLWASHRDHFRLALRAAALSLRDRSRVSGAVPLSAGNPGVPNRSTSHGPGSPSGSRFTQLQNTCGLAHCHFYSSSSSSRSLPVCDSVCIHAADIYDLVCTCRVTEGSHIGKLFITTCKNRSEEKSLYS